MILQDQEIFKELSMASHLPRVILISDRRSKTPSSLCNIFFELWDSRNGNDLKHLTNVKPFRCDGAIVHFTAARVQKITPQCSRCLVWGHAKFVCRQSYKTCAHCSGKHATRHHHEQAFCCRARPNANPPVTGTPRGVDCPHLPSCINYGDTLDDAKKHKAMLVACSFFKNRLREGWHTHHYTTLEAVRKSPPVQTSATDFKYVREKHIDVRDLRPHMKTTPPPASLQSILKAASPRMMGGSESESSSPKSNVHVHFQLP